WNVQGGQLQQPSTYSEFVETFQEISEIEIPRHLYLFDIRICEPVMQFSQKPSVSNSSLQIAVEFFGAGGEFCCHGLHRSQISKLGICKRRRLLGPCMSSPWCAQSHSACRPKASQATALQV